MLEPGLAVDIVLTYYMCMSLVESFLIALLLFIKQVSPIVLQNILSNYIFYHNHALTLIIIRYFQ